MTPEQLLPLLLGPAGLTVGAMYVVFMFSTDRWVSGKRLKQALDLLEKALDGNSEMGEAMKARNRLEREVAARAGGSIASAMEDAETIVAKRPR